MSTTSTAQIREIGDSLFLVSLPVPIDGFEGFICSWVHTAGPVVVIDVGPAVTSGHLLSALAELGVGHLDLILLTHIHIDHAGGIGPVAAAFPETPVVCHPKAVSHLIDPHRLWQGSLKTLGEIARVYGPIEPLPARQVLPADQLETKTITVIDTPGHSAHHISYLMGEILFAGEAAGIYLPLPGGPTYLRPATPPRFFLDTSLGSIDRLLAATPASICYGHMGRRTDAMHMLKTHRHQLLKWREWIQPWFDDGQGDKDVAIQLCGEDLLKKDSLMAGYYSLSPDVQKRERGFLRNAILGYWGYLNDHKSMRS